MTQNLKYAGRRSLKQPRRSRVGAMGFVTRVAPLKSRFEIKAEMLEDAYLNAIADERSDGPFVKVSLDDL
ncbi:hypothetical protein NBRC116598_21410 [Pseudophaeobacter arcticus]|uniref:Uncharacterized protein n=1 Tax=Pseudophaeobacter arcticus TaxID=385492 RepID=A0ABQ0ALF4_9RHOB